MIMTTDERLRRAVMQKAVAVGTWLGSELYRHYGSTRGAFECIFFVSSKDLERLMAAFFIGCPQSLHDSAKGCCRDLIGGRTIHDCCFERLGASLGWSMDIHSTPFVVSTLQLYDSFLP
jgi:hypothetical protein